MDPASPGAERAGRMVSPAEISVVVQGPITGKPADPYDRRLTLQALNSVRAFLPAAEIVLSTWRGSDVSGLPFDVLVESDDPGTIRCENPADARWGPVYYNADRQTVSTLRGLRAASRPHAIKLRSDMLLTGTGFLRFFGRYPARAAEWRVLAERVVVPNYFSRNPHNTLPYPFHPSDWFQFGLRDDLLAIWDVPPVDPDVPRWFGTHSRPAGDPEPWVLYRYTMEQWAWIAFLRKHGDVPVAHKFDARPCVVRLSELTFVNNLVIADRRALGVRFVKYPISIAHWRTLYTHREWQELYRRYCDPDFRVKPDAGDVRKRLYTGYLAAAHEVLISPRSSRVGGVLGPAWERRSPATFRAVKRVYSRVWAAVDRLATR